MVEVWCITFVGISSQTAGSEFFFFFDSLLPSGTAFFPTVSFEVWSSASCFRFRFFSFFFSWTPDASVSSCASFSLTPIISNSQCIELFKKRMNLEPRSNRGKRNEAGPRLVKCSDLIHLTFSARWYLARWWRGLSLPGLFSIYRGARNWCS